MTIIDSDAFLEMPLSTQALYFHLSMRADDEGFINNPKKIQRMIGCADDDLKLLIAKNFIIPFETGIVVIKHWKIHNYIRGDRLHLTKYTDERNMITTKKNGAYTLVSDECQSVDSQLADNCHTEIRLDKNRLDEIDSKESICQAEPVEIRQSDKDLVLSCWNSLQNCGIAPVTRIGDSTNRAKMLRARIREYGVEEVVNAIENIRKSDFLKGNNNKGWIITFDWFVKPNNFLKVHDGNYTNRDEQKEQPVKTVNGKVWQ